MIRLSTKQRRELSSVTSLLVHLLVFIALLLTLNSCTQEIPEAKCGTPATVKLINNGGCGYLLVLNNGAMVQPALNSISCEYTGSQNRLVVRNSIGNFNLVDGQRVLIGYKEPGESAAKSICNMSQPVEITCIEVASLPSS